VNDSAVAVLGDDVLRDIARELVDTVKKNTSIDWTIRENVQAKMRIAVKKILQARLPAGYGIESYGNGS
jgi:type I restriction enzyme R subunit